MRRIIATLLAVLYLASASGATVHLHYCMGRLLSVSLSSNEDKDCTGCCIKKKSGKGCCKNESRTIKVGDHQLAKASPVAVQMQYAVATPQYNLSQLDVYVAAYSCIATKAHAPPDIGQGRAIYKRLRNFRI